MFVCVSLDNGGYEDPEWVVSYERNFSTIEEAEEFKDICFNANGLCSGVYEWNKDKIDNARHKLVTKYGYESWIDVPSSIYIFEIPEGES